MLIYYETQISKIQIRMNNEASEFRNTFLSGPASRRRSHCGSAQFVKSRVICDKEFARILGRFRSSPPCAGSRTHGA